jgi:hypothetical protein
MLVRPRSESRPLRTLSDIWLGEAASNIASAASNPMAAAICSGKPSTLCALINDDRDWGCARGRLYGRD